MPLSSSSPSSSYTLNSSKRKFYKLLDNISSSKPNLHTSKNVSTTTLAAEPPNKRSRIPNSDLSDRPLTAPPRPLSASMERSIMRVEPSSGFVGKQRPKSYAPGVSSGIRNTRIASKLAQLDASVDRGTPNYAPWNHEQFLARLKTFADVRTWTPKPVGIGEVEWAKRGWIVVGKDTVGCKGGCEKHLLVKVVKDKSKNSVADQDDANDADEKSLWWMGDVEKAMVEKYKGLIVEGHDEGCLWRKTGCKDDIYRIQMADPAVWQKELKERYSTLLSVESALPENLEMLQQEGTEPFDVDAIAKLVPSTIFVRAPKEKENTEPTPTVETISQASADVNRTALTLALCGWSGQSPNGVQLAYCTKCFQRVGLWLYNIVPSTSTVSDIEPMIFNPIDLHREHCPWKNPDTQRAVGTLEGLAGWQVLVSLVKGYRRHDDVDKVKTTVKPSVDVDEEDSPRKSREEIKREDQVRRGRLQKLKRAFTVTGSRKNKETKT